MNKRLSFGLLFTITSIVALTFSVWGNTNTININVLEDATVHQNNKDVNYGSRTWSVVWNTAGWTNHTYYKFQLPALESNVRILSATLETYVTSGGDRVGPVGAFYCADNEWQESVLTWNNAPQAEIENEPISIATPTGNNQWVSFDVKAAIKKSAPGGMVTLVMKAINSGNDSNWYTKEVGPPYIPRIVLEYENMQSGTVVGVVQDRNGEIKAGAVVKAVSQSGDVLATANTDQDGQFQLSGITEGYRLLTEVAGYAQTYTAISFQEGGWADVTVVLRELHEDYILSVKEDTYVWQWFKDTNYGAQGWSVVGNGASNSNQTYYKFQIPEVGNNFRIVSATLKSYVYQNGDKVGPVDVFYCGDNSWKESTLTWNNSPHSEIESEPSATATPTGNNQWVTFDMRSVIPKAASDGTLSLVLKAGPTNSNWYTKENQSGAYAPYISLTLEYIQPGTVTGMVKDRNGDKKVGATVKAILQSGDILSEVLTDINGEFQFTGLEEGTIFLTELDGYARTFTDVNFQEGGWADVTVVLREYSETYVISAIADTNIHQAHRDNNYGGVNWSVIWNSSLGWTNQTYYQFQLPDYGNDYRIISANLESYVYAGGDKIGPVGAFYCEDKTWDENTLTWNNAPHSMVSTEPSGVAIPGGNNVWVKFNILSAIKKAIPNGQLSMVMKALNPGQDSYWYTKESQGGAFSPRLALTLEYMEPGSVAGVVIDSEGNPLPGAMIKLFTQSSIEVASTFADDEGSFTIKCTEPGAHRILVYLDNYVLKESSIEVNLDSWIDLVIVLEKTHAQTKILPLADAGVVEQGPNNNNGGGNYLLLAPDGGYGQLAWYKFQLPTLDDSVTIASATFKNYLFGGIIEQKISLHPSAYNNWQEMEITWANQPDYDKKPLVQVIPEAVGYIDFDLTPWVTTKDGDQISFVLKGEKSYSSWYTREASTGAFTPYIELVLIPMQRYIQGQITDSWSSSSIAGAKVEVRDLKTQELKKSILTNEQGRYSLSVTPGMYQLIIRKEGFVAQSQELILQSDQDYTYNVSLEPVKLSIILKMDSVPEEPVNNSLARLKRDGKTISIAEGDEEGLLMLARVPAGEYELELRAPGHKPKIIEVLMPDEDDLYLEETLEYTGDFTPPSPVEGFVLDTNEAGQVKMSWQNSDEAEGVVAYSIYRANADESFDLDNPIAVVEARNNFWADIDVVSKEYLYAIRSEDNSSNYSQLVGPLSATPKPVFGFLEGWVRDSSDKPIAGVEIDVGFCKVFSDNDGYYIVNSIPSGDYIASAKREGYSVNIAEYSFKIRLNQLEHRYDFTLTFEAPPAGAREWLTLVNARPSPFIAGREGVTITHIPKEGVFVTSVEIFDLNGRLVRNLDLANPNWTYWDGLDRRGEPVSSGIYLALIKAERGRVFEQLRTTCVIIAIK